MRIIGKRKLEKLRRKNLGNKPLSDHITKLITDIKNAEWKTEIELKKDRPDADKVHADGFYFFDVSIHRTMILIEFEPSGEATLVWLGTHQEYERKFKNNKRTIEKWLKQNNWI